MSSNTSPEFTALCRSQLQLLCQTLGAVSAVIYTAEAGAQPSFVPVFQYPAANVQAADAPLALPSDALGEMLGQDYLWSADSQLQLVRPSVASDRQAILPLIYQEAVVGLLVLVHRDRAWQAGDRPWLQQVADSLAAGYVLERQNRWLRRRLAAKQQLQGHQSEIFHNLLHQFRNPLTALNTFGQLLRRRLQAEDPNAAVADSIVRETKRLRALVGDFDQTVALGDADWQEEAQPEGYTDSYLGAYPNPHTGGQRLELTEVNPEAGGRSPLWVNGVSARGGADKQSPAGGLGHALTLRTQPLLPLLDPLLSLGQALAADRHRRFCAQIPTDSPQVVADAQALQEVLGNLLDNALKYAQSGAWVWVQVNPPDAVTQQVGIAVGDTGPGIPAQDQPRLFERRYRGVQSQGKIPGTGLGLAIAAALVQQMHGHIQVVSPITSDYQAWIPLTVQADRAAMLTGTLFIVWLPALGTYPSG